MSLDHFHLRGGFVMNDSHDLLADSLATDYVPDVHVVVAVLVTLEKNDLDGELVIIVLLLHLVTKLPCVTDDLTDQPVGCIGIDFLRGTIVIHLIELTRLPRLLDKLLGIWMVLRHVV